MHSPTWQVAARAYQQPLDRLRSTSDGRCYFRVCTHTIELHWRLDESFGLNYCHLQRTREVRPHRQEYDSVRVSLLGRVLLPAVLIVLVSCEGGSTFDVDDRRIAVITIRPATPSIDVGGTVQLAATAYDTESNIVSAATFVWSSFNEAVATVNENGLVMGVAEGTAIIDAKIPAVAVSAGSASVTVTSAAAAAASADR